MGKVPVPVFESVTSRSKSSPWVREQLRRRSSTPSPSSCSSSRGSVASDPADECSALRKSPARAPCRGTCGSRRWRSWPNQAPYLSSVGGGSGSLSVAELRAATATGTQGHRQQHSRKSEKQKTAHFSVSLFGFWLSGLW